MENISSTPTNAPMNEQEDCATNADNQHTQQEDEPEEDASKPRRRRRKKKGDADTTTTATPKVPPQTSRLWVDDPSFERKIIAAGWGNMLLDGAASVSTHTTDSRHTETVEPESRWTDPAVAILFQDAMRREQEKLAAIRRVAVEGADPRAVWVPASSVSANQQQPQQKNNVSLQNGIARSAWDEPVVGVQFLNSLLPAVKADWSGVVEPDATDLSAARARLDELD
ncbi:hypothetical protein BJ741DRAFT_632714 [Chytriomyces cf. hyalinus JEL632]|nr:hypothetical protein BJ741DRAFT_632714 [Chytriomyces cf. hyalinus JEL632]